MFTWLMRHLRWHVREAALSFEVDADDAGSQTVATYATFDGGRERIANIDQAWDYGRVFEQEGQLYSLPMESVETLLALRTQAPKPARDGCLAFEVHPPILQYLRSRDGITEGPRSRNIKISDEPFKPIVEIDFDPKFGLNVQAGFTFDGSTRISHDRIETSRDGSYVRVDDTFYPPLPTIPNAAKEMFDVGQVIVPPAEIPEFFTRDLVLLL